MTYTKIMKFLAAFLIIAASFAAMALGLIVAGRTLKKGCSLGSDCLCKNDPEKSPKDCEHMS
jgi:hypothetical protein